MYVCCLLTTFKILDNVWIWARLLKARLEFYEVVPQLLLQSAIEIISDGTHALVTRYVTLY